MPLPSPDPANRLRRALFSKLARRIWAAVMLLAMVVVLAIALSPHPRGPSLGWDKANHAAAFATLAFAGLFALREQARPVFWVSLVLLALGVGIELLQTQVPGRDAEWRDVVADGVGIAFGLLLATRLAQRLDRRTQRRGPHG